ncbi:MAG: laccase domain-containing protein [Rubrobacter sp.]|nr:laccase domain-containing protein [Rubrobacter sp.]
MAPKHTEALAPGTAITAAGGAVFIEPNPAPKNAKVQFFTRLGGVSEPPFDSLNVSTKVGDEAGNVEENLSRIRDAMDGNPSAWVKQVAGDEVVRVSEGGFAGEADALITNESGLSLVVGVADCVLVALVGEESVGMVHSGWRGTLSGISGKAAREMVGGVFGTKGEVDVAANSPMSSHPATETPVSSPSETNVPSSGGAASEIAAYIGPCIRRCCYEVSEEMAEKFAREFGENVVSGRNLSLPDAIRVDLVRSGVSEIHDLGMCTGCRPDLFFSHRKEKPATGRNLAAISMSSEAGS